MSKLEHFWLAMYVTLTLIPLVFLLINILPAGERVDPEIMNGLLAASSIIFGFAALFVGMTKRNLTVDLMFSVDLTLLFLSGFFIFFYGLKLNNGLAPLVLTASSLNANGATALYSRSLERSERIERLKRYGERRLSEAKKPIEAKKGM